MRKNGKLVLMVLLAGLALLICLQAAAQSEQPSSIYSPTTVYVLPQDSFSVDRDGPNGIRIDGIRQTRLKNLIKFRQDFRLKALSSAKGL